jgi:hypothetical protein
MPESYSYEVAREVRRGMNAASRFAAVICASIINHELQLT